MAVACPLKGLVRCGSYWWENPYTVMQNVSFKFEVMAKSGLVSPSSKQKRDPSNKAVGGRELAIFPLGMPQLAHRARADASR